MLKAELNCNATNGKSVLMASGPLKEIICNVSVIINGIHSQLRNSSPASAAAFRFAITQIVNDTEGPLWKPQDGQIGIAIHNQQEEEE